MTWPGWLGLALMAVGLLLVLFGAASLFARALRVRRRMVALEQLLAQGGGAVLAELEELHTQSQERQALLRPYRRWTRRLRHPLAVALAQSYLRRRRVARA